MRLRFAEIPDRSTAEALRGRYLVADVDAPLPPGHHYWHELLGMQVRDETGRALGRVVDVYRAGGGEVVSVAGEPFGPLEVPLVIGIVRILDPTGEGLVVDGAALGLEASEGNEAVPAAADRGEAVVAAMPTPEAPHGSRARPTAPGRQRARPARGEGGETGARR